MSKEVQAIIEYNILFIAAIQYFINSFYLYKFLKNRTDIQRFMCFIPFFKTYVTAKVGKCVPLSILHPSIILLSVYMVRSTIILTGTHDLEKIIDIVSLSYFIIFILLIFIQIIINARFFKQYNDKYKRLAFLSTLAPFGKTIAISISNKSIDIYNKANIRDLGTKDLSIYKTPKVKGRKRWEI